MSNEDYLKQFHWIVTSGWVCGLSHPIEWMVNALRTPGGTFSSDYYEQMENITARYLCETYEAVECSEPKDAKDILTWCDDHYPEGHLCKGFFDRFEKNINTYIQLKNDEKALDLGG